MDKYTKFILTVIAVALIGILFKEGIITTAHAFNFPQSNQAIAALYDIANAIRACN